MSKCRALQWSGRDGTGGDGDEAARHVCGAAAEFQRRAVQTGERPAASQLRVHIQQCRRLCMLLRYIII